MNIEIFSKESNSSGDNDLVDTDVVVGETSEQ